jgi:hypothetical protein
MSSRAAIAGARRAAHVRAETLSPQERKAIARRAAFARASALSPRRRKAIAKKAGTSKGGRGSSGKLRRLRNT